MRAGSIGLFLLHLFGVLAGGGCSPTKADGTDSSTHWTYCRTVDDCPSSGDAYECRDGRCVAATSTSDSGATRGRAGTGGAPATNNGATGGSSTPSAGGSSSGGRSAIAGSGGVASQTGGRSSTQPDPATPDADTSDAGPFTACTLDSDCALVNATCCGRCGEAGPGDKLAVNAAHVEDWYRTVCGDGGACPPCIPLDGPYDALCDHGRCVAGRLAEVKVCLRSEDCAVKPKDCCPCGDLAKNDVVALNPSFDYYPACSGSCPVCTSGVHIAEGIQASCFSGGYCILQ